MSKEKLTWTQFKHRMREFNEEHGVVSKGSNGPEIFGVVVYTENSFTKHYSEVQRSYRVSNKNKYFIDGQIGNSIYADCLDNSEFGVRLDWYLEDWTIDYCYFEEENIDYGKK